MPAKRARARIPRAKPRGKAVELNVVDNFMAESNNLKPVIVNIVA